MHFVGILEIFKAQFNERPLLILDIIKSIDTLATFLIKLHDSKGFKLCNLFLGGF